MREEAAEFFARATGAYMQPETAPARFRRDSTRQPAAEITVDETRTWR